MRKKLLCLLLAIYVSLSTQNINILHIQAEKSETFNLSEIAEHIEPVGIEMNQGDHFDCISDVLWTNKYLFISVYSLGFNERLPTRVLQYDLSGKFIREIGEQSTNIRKLFCDTERNLLFIPEGKEIHCYDFEGKLKNTYLLIDTPGLYDKGYFWIQYISPQQNEMRYSLIGYDMETQKEEMLFDYIDNSSKVENVLIGRPACFSFWGQTPVVSFGLDNKLYQIEGKKITPIVEYIIEPSLSSFEKVVPGGIQGFIGNYLCIHFWNNLKQNLYLKNMSTGQVFQTKYSFTKEGILTGGIKDDLLATGFCDITPLNRPGYFYFIKKREEQVDNPNFPEVKIPFTIFFVKLKQ